MISPTTIAYAKKLVPFIFKYKKAEHQTLGKSMANQKVISPVNLNDLMKVVSGEDYKGLCALLVSIYDRTGHITRNSDRPEDAYNQAFIDLQKLIEEIYHSK